MSYDTRNDGTLNCKLSTKIGDAGPSMVRLIQEHMVVILQPINQHIEHLYQKHADLARGVNATDETVEKNRQRLVSDEADLAAQESKHARWEKELKMLQAELKDTDARSRLVACEADIRQNRKARIDFDERLERTNKAIEAFQPLLDDSNAAIHRVELKIWQTENLSERFDRDMEELRKELSSYDERQLGLARGIEHFQAAHENTRKCVVKLTADVEAHHKQERKDASAVAARTKVLEETSAQTSSNLVALEESVKAKGAEINVLNDQVLNTQEAMRSLEEENHKQDAEDEQQNAKLAEMQMEEARKQVTVMERMKELEGALVKIKQVVNRELEKNIPDKMRDLTLTVERQMSSMTNSAASLRSLETMQNGHQERLLHLEKHSADNVAVQADLVKRADLAHVNISDLISAHRSVETKIEIHQTELEKMEAFGSTTRHALGQTNAAVQHLNGDLGTAKGGLANTAMRLDLAHEYISGVSKGLQETHKLCISGQDGMASSKYGLDRTRPLPVIGASGRPSVQRGKATPRAPSGSAEYSS